MSPFRDDYDIDYSYGNNLGEVAELVSKFVRDSSAFPDDYVESGDYGNNRGSTKNYAVESTVVLTDMEQVQKLYHPCLVIPRRMLAEMKKFFEFL